MRHRQMRLCSRWSSERAAGILARLEKINEILLSGVVFVLAAPPTPDTAAGTLHDLVADAIGALGIGQPLSLRRLGALVYQVNGLAEAAEVQLRYRKADLNNPGEFLTGAVTDPFLPAQTELVKPDTAHLAVDVLTRLAVAAAGDGTTDVDVSLLDAAGQAAHFVNYAVDLSVTLRAKLANTPDQPPEVVGRFTRTATFVDSSVFTTSISLADSAAAAYRWG